MHGNRIGGASIIASAALTLHLFNGGQGVSQGRSP
jgi:hypothetical protein